MNDPLTKKDINYAEIERQTYLGTSPPPKMELFVKIVNS